MGSPLEPLETYETGAMPPTYAELHSHSNFSFLHGASPVEDMAERAAERLEIPLQRAVFVAVAGPNLETAAEYRFLRWIGADIVGMSLVPEVIAAVHGGQRVLAFNVVTDTCDPDHLKPVSIPEILKVAGDMAPVLIRLVTEVVRRLDEVTENRLSPAENR